MQIARTFAIKNNENDNVSIRVLFDSGSQITYITENLKTQLDLDVQGSETLNLNTFGSDKFHKHKFSKVSLKLETSDSNYVEKFALTYPV